MRFSAISNRFSKALSQKLPLRFILIVPFTLEVFVAVGTTGYLSLQNGQKAIDDLIEQLQHEVNGRIEQHLDSYLSVPSKLSRLNAAAIEQGVLDDRDLDQIGRFFWQQFQSYDVGYILFGKTNGELVATGYYANNAPLTIALLSPQQNDDLNSYAYETDSKGNRTRLNYVFENYAFQQEGWYRQTLTSGHPTWTEIYQWETEPYPLSISAGYPVRDQNNRLIGAVGVDLRLSQISDFLQRLKIGTSGKAFIIERSGLLVASSSNEPLYTIQKGAPVRLNAANSSDPIIRETIAHLTRTNGALESIQTEQQLSFRLKDQQEFVQVRPWRDSLGLDWLMVVVLPESDFAASAHANNRITIILCIVSFGIALIFGFYTSRWLAQPVLRLSEASEKLAESARRGFAEQPDISLDYTTHISELDTLARSFTSMSEQLQETFGTLENANEKLEFRVVERTQELSAALENLKQTQAQLIQTEKMSSLGQMVAGIAHEINNPVNFIHGNLDYASRYLADLFELLRLYEMHSASEISAISQYSEQIELAFLKEDLPKLFSSMAVGTQRIREIVLSLRNFSRLDEAALKESDLHEGINNTLLILQHRFYMKSNCNIKIVKSYGDIPLVECYPGLLNQVFMNILSNAIDAIQEHELLLPKLEGVITITTQKITDDRIRITLSDNGIGIPESVQTKLFDPFFTTKSIGKGTGLGLSISYQIVVEQHSGTLNCISTVGKGTTFIVELPQNQTQQMDCRTSALNTAAQSLSHP